MEFAPVFQQPPPGPQPDFFLHQQQQQDYHHHHQQYQAVHFVQQQSYNFVQHEIQVPHHHHHHAQLAAPAVFQQPSLTPLGVTTSAGQSPAAAAAASVDSPGRTPDSGYSAPASLQTPAYYTNDVVLGASLDNGGGEGGGGGRGEEDGGGGGRGGLSKQSDSQHSQSANNPRGEEEAQQQQQQQDCGGGGEDGLDALELDLPEEILKSIEASSENSSAARSVVVVLPCFLNSVVTIPLFLCRLCYHCNEENNGNSSFSWISHGRTDNGLCQRCARPLQPALRAEDEEW